MAFAKSLWFHVQESCSPAPVTASNKVSLPASLLYLLCQLLFDFTLFLGTTANFATNYPQNKHTHQSGKGSVFGHTWTRLTYSLTGISAGFFVKEKKKTNNSSLSKAEVHLWLHKLLRGNTLQLIKFTKYGFTACNPFQATTSLALKSSSP